jgi:phenylpropionate dioxygenase-like ring-hydroxylating dioxygenase large terminal subunit
MSTHEYRLIASTKAPKIWSGTTASMSRCTTTRAVRSRTGKIFYRTWVWVAHESEVRNAGDFKTAIGRRPVIVVRDKKNTINVLENRCRHRGATVCEKHKGNATGFTCPYHSWSYGLDGKLRALPYPDGYEGILENPICR